MTVPTFGGSVACVHTRIDISEYGSIYVVGDVHGCIAELRTLWERLGPTSEDLVVFVGDLVRKGPASDAVVEFVRTRDNALSVRGNNEEMIIRGEETAGLSAASRDAIESFPLIVSWEDAMVVHGGVNPNMPLGDHSPDDLLEMRAVPREKGYEGPFWFDSYEGPPRIYFGHTVLTEPLIREWTVGLDTGCVHGGSLTAYDYQEHESVSVSAAGVYVPRSDERILRP